MHVHDRGHLLGFQDGRAIQFGIKDLAIHRQYLHLAKLLNVCILGILFRYGSGNLLEDKTFAGRDIVTGLAKFCDEALGAIAVHANFLCRGLRTGSKSLDTRALFNFLSIRTGLTRRQGLDHSFVELNL